MRTSLCLWTDRPATGCRTAAAPWRVTFEPSPGRPPSVHVGATRRRIECAKSSRGRLTTCRFRPRIRSESRGGASFPPRPFRPRQRRTLHIVRRRHRISAHHRHGFLDKGKPSARVGRKAMGPSGIARLPKGTSPPESPTAALRHGRAARAERRPCRLSGSPDGPTPCRGRAAELILVSHDLFPRS